jgi:hypothetical protein
MIRRIVSVAVLLAVAAVGRAGDKPIELFNGKNLDGWKAFLDPRARDAKPEDVWSVKEGVIVCKGRPAGYIITEKEYDNYVLRLKWRWPGRAGNSGVLLHTTGPDKIWPKSAEAQLASGQAGDFWLIDFKLDIDKARQDPRVARHYFRIGGREKKVEKPVGEWNEYEITCKGDTITLKINGELVNEGKNAEKTRGKILLQSEGAEIHFKDITLTPLGSEK